VLLVFATQNKHWIAVQDAKGRRPDQIGATASDNFSEPRSLATFSLFRYLRKLDFLFCNLRQNRQSVLNLQALNLTVSKFLAETDECRPGGMELLGGSSFEAL
jgi:hypothetical protein